MPALDLKKTLKLFYQPSSKKISIVEVPPLDYLMVDGEGDPNKSLAFQEAVEALYGMAYTLKFISKKQRDARISPLCRWKASGGWRK
jgi:hypothetical protein